MIFRDGLSFYVPFVFDYIGRKPVREGAESARNCVLEVIARAAPESRKFLLFIVMSVAGPRLFFC